MANRNTTKESEKRTDRILSSMVKSRGGRVIKLSDPNSSGLPDRLILLPGGRTLFVEVKSEGRKLTPLQKFTHIKLRGLGFEVHMAEKYEDLEEIFAL